MKTPVRQNVASVAASVPGSVLQKNWLHPVLEKLEVQGGGLLRQRARGALRRSCPNPICKYFPFWVGLRGPELSPPVRRIAPAFFRKRVKKEATFQGIR